VDDGDDAARHGQPQPCCCHFDSSFFSRQSINTATPPERLECRGVPVPRTATTSRSLPQHSHYRGVPLPARFPLLPVVLWRNSRVLRQVVSNDGDGANKKADTGSACHVYLVK